MALILRCPKCRQTMKYVPSKGSKSIYKKRKRCVYCGRSFSVREHLVKIEK
ncbi:MAG: hypothetical protein MAG795_01103 [Candidatus Woesearchaeota archaeon]|nr:hypothetical protein [Candidatus Woesearchaeota archaeon]